MSKSYSRFTLLQKRINGPTEKKGFLSYLLTNHRVITVEMPYYDFLRGRVFLDDLRDNYGDQVPYHFDIGGLIHMTYNDFLNQVKRGAAPNEQVAAYISGGKQRYFPVVKREKQVMKPLTDHVFEFSNMDEEEEEEYDDKNKTAYLDIRMKESEVLRGEILIHDLEPYLNNVQVSIEQLISIVYLDFIQTVKTDGNSLKVQKSILTHLKKY